VGQIVSAQVRAMIDLQALTGARLGELVGLRACDLKTGGDVWEYRPERHKTAHRGVERRMHFGRRAQAILLGFIAGRALDVPLFSAAEADCDRRARATAARRTPAS